MFMAFADKMNGARRKFPLNWGLLLFLVLVLDVKLAIKIPALVIACCLQPGFGRRGHQPGRQAGAQPGSWFWRGLPLFYPLMIVLALVDWILFKGFTDRDYDLVALAGIGSWLCCMAAVYQVRLFTEGSETETLHRTLLVFFALNALVSVADMVRIVWETKALNPYLYQGMYQKYFIRTGDYIKGISFDTSTTNAVINAFGAVYFLKRKNGWMLLCCMACLLATGSNFTNLLLLGVFVCLFVFDSDREQKGGIVLCVVMGAVFLGKVSPQNNHYTEETLMGMMQRGAPQVAALKPAAADSTDIKRTAYARFYLDSVRLAGWLRAKSDSAAGKGSLAALKQWKPKPALPEPNINEGAYLRKDDDTSADQRVLYAFIDDHRRELPLAGHLPASLTEQLASSGEGETHAPGKWVAFKQVFGFLHNHPERILTGNGAGNFSSKLAFRSTGLGIMGGFPARYVYISPDFLGHHLDIYLDFFAKPKQMHSLTNSPDSVYGQVLGEYGAMGLLFLAVFYIGFFVRQLRQAGTLRRGGYGLALVVILAGSFLIGYWFEQLSIVILFEVLLFTEVKPASE